jgi:hypothetical protein
MRSKTSTISTHEYRNSAIFYSRWSTCVRSKPCYYRGSDSGNEGLSRCQGRTVTLSRPCCDQCKAGPSCRWHGPAIAGEGVRRALLGAALLRRWKGSRDGLGPASGPDARSLKAAPEIASAFRLKVASGVDPLEERQLAADTELAERQKVAANERANVTFKVCAKAFIATHEASWKNDKHRAQWTSTMETSAYPVIGDMPVADVDAPHVIAVLSPFWHAKPETAGRVRGRIEHILDAARVRLGFIALNCLTAPRGFCSVVGKFVAGFLPLWLISPTGI